MAEVTAGGSAAAKAQELREKAARLEEEARQWDKGAEGERRTAAVLSQLARHGYVVLDDLSIPGSKANIDHVVIGPTGVAVIETKAYSGKLALKSGVLWHGKYPLRRELGAARFEADKVREVVASTGWTVAVRSLMCVHGVDVPSDPAASLAPIELCGPLDLLAKIEAAPPLLTPAHVAHLATVVEQALPPRRIALPSPPPVAAPAVARSRRDVVVPFERSRRRRASLPTSHRVLRSVDSGVRRVAALAAACLLVLIGAAVVMAIASATLQAVGDQVTTTTSTTVVTVPPPTVPPAPQ